MKKIIYLFFISLILPLGVYAKTPTKEEIIKVISQIENTQVEEDTMIQKTRVDDKNIIFEIEKKEEIEKVSIPYYWDGNILTFEGGYIDWDFEQEKTKGEIKENENAFYLYSILESLSLIPYNPTSYYNNQNIQKLIDENKNNFNKEETNTFGVRWEKKKDNYETPRIQIYYQYNLEGDYPILGKIEEDSDFRNPNTGNITTYGTITLVLLLIVAAYSYETMPKKRKRIEG